MEEATFFESPAEFHDWLGQTQEIVSVREA